MIEQLFDIVKVIDDPSGNSFIQSRMEGIEEGSDEKLSMKKYKRSEEQDKQLGIYDTTTKVF